MKKLLLVLAVATSLIVVPSVDATVREVKDEKAVEILYTCDKAADVTVHAGSTNRNWRVNGVEQWLSFYDIKTWEDVELPVIVEWWHENSQAWKPADESYTSESKEQDCPEPTPTPTTEVTPTPTVEPTPTPMVEVTPTEEMPTPTPTVTVKEKGGEVLPESVEVLPETGTGSFAYIFGAIAALVLGLFGRMLLKGKVK